MTERNKPTTHEETDNAGRKNLMTRISEMSHLVVLALTVLVLTWFIWWPIIDGVIKREAEKVTQAAVIKRNTERIQELKEEFEDASKKTLDRIDEIEDALNSLTDRVLPRSPSKQP